MQQVAVGAVDFHAIYPGVDGVPGGAAELLDNVWQLIGVQGARHWAVFPRFEVAHRRARSHRGRRDRLRPLLQAGVGEAPGVHHLHENVPAGLVDGVGDAPPPGHLLRGVDARLTGEGPAGNRREDAFGDNEAERGALCVVRLVQRGGNAVAARARAREWSHDDAVWQGQATHFEGIKE